MTVYLKPLTIYYGYRYFADLNSAVSECLISDHCAVVLDTYCWKGVLASKLSICIYGVL